MVLSLLRVYGWCPRFIENAIGRNGRWRCFCCCHHVAVAGIRSDRKGSQGGRVKWLRWGYGLPVFGKAIIALATVWPFVVGGRLLDRFGKGLRGAPRDALIADAVFRGAAGTSVRTAPSIGYRWCNRRCATVCLSTVVAYRTPQSNASGETVSAATETRLGFTDQSSHRGLNWDLLPSS